MTINSRSKGQRSERQAAKYLSEKLHIYARRSQQYCGAAGTADLYTDLDAVHWEIKAAEKLNIHNAIAQAVRDGGDKIPLVLHKKNRTGWLLTMRADDILRFVEHVFDKIVSKPTSNDQSCVCPSEQNQPQCQNHESQPIEQRQLDESA